MRTMNTSPATTWTNMHRSSAWHLIKRVVRTATAGVGDDELMTRAAALAFYSALSFAPLLVLALWVCASLSPAWRHDLVAQITDTVGPRAAEAVRLVIDNARQRRGAGYLAGLAGLAVTVLSASAVFTQLQGAINRVWGLSARPGRAWLWWLRARMHAFGLLVALAFLLVVSFAASALITALVPHDSTAWGLLDLVISMAVFTVVFAAIFKVLPDAVIHWQDAVIGGVLTSLLFTAGKFAIGVYLAHSQVGGAYGPASSVVVLLVWMYYAATIVLLGAELTAAVAAERGRPIRPRAYAESRRMPKPHGHWHHAREHLRPDRSRDDSG